MLQRSRQSLCQYQQILILLVLFATESESNGGTKSSHSHQRGRTKSGQMLFHVKAGPSRPLDSTELHIIEGDLHLPPWRDLLTYLFSLDHQDVDRDVLYGTHSRQGLRQPNPMLTLHLR
jgi:hypothetical protein